MKSVKAEEKTCWWRTHKPNLKLSTRAASGKMHNYFITKAFICLHLTLIAMNHSIAFLAALSLWRLKISETFGQKQLGLNICQIYSFHRLFLSFTKLCDFTKMASTSLTLNFSGGAESLFDGKRVHEVTIKETDKLTVAQLLKWILVNLLSNCDKTELLSKSQLLFFQIHQPRPA